VEMEDVVENLSEKKMGGLVDEEILKNHLLEDVVKEVIEAEVLQEPVEIDQIGILVVTEDLLDLEENEEKEDKTKLNL